MGKGQKWDLEDLTFVLRLYKQRTKQREINRLLIADRKSRGVWEGEKDLSNRISRLSPNSKHRSTEERKIRNRVGYDTVTRFIQKCKRCDQTKASEIYTNHIYLSGIAPYDFYDPNNRSMATIRYNVPREGCKAPLYIAFTSDDYDFMDEEDIPDIWTVLSPYTYNQILNGKITVDKLQDYLFELADGEYIPIFLNTVVLVNIEKY
jgi:hypothetical protein